jgi:hypothetical protein
LKRIKLGTNVEFDGIIWGISSPEHGYRLSYFINKALRYNLQKVNDAEDVIEKKHQEITLKQSTVYGYNDQQNGIEAYLVVNKNQGKLVLPKLKDADYLFLIKGRNFDTVKGSVEQHLKSINIIQMVFPVPPKSFKPEKFLNIDQSSF